MSAGASLTPTPVIAVTQPWRCEDFTISSLSSGLAQTTTRTLLVRASVSALLRKSPSGRNRAQSTVATSSLSSGIKILTLHAMAMAVFR